MVTASSRRSAVFASLPAPRNEFPATIRQVSDTPKAAATPARLLIMPPPGVYRTDHLRLGVSPSFRVPCGSLRRPLQEKASGADGTRQRRAKKVADLHGTADIMRWNHTPRRLSFRAIHSRRCPVAEASESSSQTIQLHRCLDRLRAGD